MAAKSAKGKAGLVIVESPTKARKIASYLGPGYRVMASMGHIRDLPASAKEIPPSLRREPWANLGVNVEKDFEPLYVVPKEKKKVVQQLKQALKEASELIVATDEDREGESIGWHLTQVLQPKVPVKRMAFSEITKEAIQEAIRHPRSLDHNLVSAQEARRILDRLVGYRLSPLLWKKIARGLSAGRVQSVAVRMLVERELQRMAFKRATYWDLKARLLTPEERPFEAVLISVHGKRVATGKDFDETTGQLKPDADVHLVSEEEAAELAEKLRSGRWHVVSVETREQVRKPYAPFTTSTLQQEANRKLGFSAGQTMQVAQRLYENGYITYMRTDSVHLSDEAIQATRQAVEQRYGKEYLSDQPRRFVTKSRLAQEAHEAIRPAGTEMKTGEELGLTGDDLKLYTLIWKRTMATQMAEAKLRFQTVIVRACDAEFRATGRYVVFPGFFRAYVEGVDDPEAALDDQEATLPPLEEGDVLTLVELQPVSHETKPPPRYTEATLVRELESQGIGRPSTYASIITTIQERGYARKVGNQLVPTFTAMAVTRLLERFFPKLIDYQFTARMEEALDEIASGHIQRLPYLKQFYYGDDGLDAQVKRNEQAIDPREACMLELTGLDARIRVGRYGPYVEKEENGKVVTASLPSDLAPADLTKEKVEELLQQKRGEVEPIGIHPEENLPIYVLQGPYGPYVQLGQATDKDVKPKRVSIPKNLDPQQLTVEQAIFLLSLPKTLGVHPETGKPVRLGIGRYGPYVYHDGKYKSVPRTVDIFSVDLDTALRLLALPKGARLPLRDLGPHPDDGEPVMIYDGRYGPYVKHGSVNASLPKDVNVEDVTLEQALQWLEEKKAKETTKSRKRKTS